MATEVVLPAPQLPALEPLPVVQSATTLAHLTPPLTASPTSSAQQIAASLNQADMPLSTSLTEQPLVRINSVNGKSKMDVYKPPSKEEHVKIQDLVQKKLTTIETQRVMAVMDETIKNVEMVSLFFYTAENLDRFGVVLGFELSGAIRAHQRLQDSMLSLLSRTDEANKVQQALQNKEKGVGGFSGMEGEGVANGKLPLLQQAIRSSVKNTLRLFHTNHAAAETIRAESGASAVPIQNLIQALFELREFLFEKLLTSPLEQNEQTRHLTELIKREQKHAEMIKVLEANLAKEIEDRDAEIAKKNEVIRQLKIQLHQLERFSEEIVRRTSQESDQQQKSDNRVCETNCTKLQQDLQRSRTQLNNDIAEHKEIEVALRKKKFKVETEIENWIQKFDVEMTEKQSEIEDLQIVFDEEEAQHFELQEKMDLLEQEYLQIVEEREQAQLKKEAEERELAILTRAATIIQALWKGYLVRKLFRSKKKKGKKGKSGKKGKKGK
ncbi:dynein regulatory complex protein 10 [Ambystoma mexicanum]|uniref:dynein regulatory complex protein 10 n=1 Tax=Ambystoma mexicanum TaxID=8296 RepID=UPI0037E80BFD